jgi:glycosyltransferase involved in cell wall biosynthesis
MRVLLVAKSAFSGVHGEGRSHPAILSGHTVGFVRSFLRTAGQRGHEVTYVYPGFVGPGEACFFDAADTAPIEVDARPFWDDQLPKSAVSAAAVELCAQVSELCASAGTRPDVAVFVYPFPLLTLLAPILDRAGVPYVASLRGGDAYRWLAPPPDDATPGQVAVRSAYLAALQGCTSLTAASSWLADVARDAGLDVDAVIGSPPPAPDDEQPGDDDPVGRKLRYLSDGYRPIAGENLRPQRRWLLWSGRLSKDKRPDLVLRAFNRAKAEGWQLVVAGDGDRSLLPAALPPGVAHVFVPPRNLPQILRACDGAIHTAVPGDFIDARPSSVLAASAYGLPCITVRSDGVGGTDECVSPEVLSALGVERTGDDDGVVAGLAASIRTLAGDDDRREHLSADVVAWARVAGLWTTMDHFLDLTAKAAEAAASAEPGLQA